MSWWLIEGEFAGVILYYVAESVMWTRDANKAHKFYSEGGAQRIRDRSCPSSSVVREHVFVEPEPKP